MARPHPRILCSDRVVVSTSDGPRVRPAAVWVDGMSIAAVEPLDSVRQAPPGAVVERLGERVLAPAFVNAHTHLAMGAFRGVTTAAARAGNVVTDLFFRLEQALTAADVRAFTRMGAYECLLTGSAEVWDHYYFGEAVAEALLDVGLTGVVAPTLQDLAGPGAERWEDELAATERIARSDRLRGRGVRAALGPHATDTVSSGLFTEVVQEAKRLGLPVHLHVAQSIEEVEAVDRRHGCSPIELLARQGVLDLPRALLVHCVFAADGDLARLDPERHYVGVCPFSQMQFAFPTPVERLTRAGLPWVVGTDCVASNDAMGLQKELGLLGGVAALRAAFSEEATAHGRQGGVAAARRLDEKRRRSLDAWSDELAPERLLARAWGSEGRLAATVTGGWEVGTVRAGAVANLVVYDAAHPCFWPGDDVLRTLAYADTSAAIWGLMVAGEWRGTPGDFPRSLLESPEYRDAEKEATQRRRALLERLAIPRGAEDAPGSTR